MATRTVGYGKTYATIALAVAAAANEDTIEIYPRTATSHCYYDENSISITKALTYVGMDPGIIWSHTGGSYLALTGSKNLVFRDLLIDFDPPATTIFRGGWNKLTFERCRIIKRLQRRLFYSLDTGAGTRDIDLLNCELVLTSFGGSATGDEVDKAGATVRIVNCTGVFTYSHQMFRLGTGALVYNNIFITEAGVAAVSGTFTASHNQVTTALGGAEENVIASAVVAGLVSQNTSGPGYDGDYRTLLASEVAGSNSIGGLDIAALLGSFDIDLRSRTIYARGCSEKFSLWPGADNVLDSIAGGNWTKAAKAFVLITHDFGIGGTSEVAAYPGAVAPGDPTLDSVVSVGDGEVTLVFTAAAPADIVYARYRENQTGTPWADESESFKRTGSGNITITGLDNDTEYEFSGYGKESATSDWTGTLLATPTNGTAAMLPEEAFYKLITDDAAVTALISGAMFPNYAPQSTDLPYLIYRRITSEHFHQMETASGLLDCSIQLDIYGSTYVNAKAIAEAVREAIDGYHGIVSGGGKQIKVHKLMMTNESDGFERGPEGTDLPYQRVIQTWDFWCEESIPSV